MGFYRERILPRFQDRAMDRKVMHEPRSRACAGLTGDVLEVGFGTGLNAAHYPPEVVRVFAIEPSAACVHLAEPRIARSSAEIELAGRNAEHLDLPSDRFDGVLSTWTLCSIPNLAAALGELRRVLKPGGSFHFIEHGHAPDPNVARWQARLEPLNKRLAGGCHLTRDIPRAITDAGFTVKQLDAYYFKGEPRAFGFTFEGRAVRV